MKLSEKNLFSQFDPRSGKCNEKSENIMKYRKNLLFFFFWLITDIKFVLKIIRMKKYIFHVNFKYTKFLRFQPKFQVKFR